MTDNEIIKVLECCGSPYNRCLECPLCETERVKCFTEMSANALNLINRQKAEIKRVNGVIKNFKATKNRQKAEIERLKNECFCLANERDAYKDVLDTAVTDTVKEFLDELIDISVCKDNGDGTESLYVSIPKARQVLKEMEVKQNDEL